MPAKRGSLIVVGTGIAAAGQLTVEARSVISEADEVLFAVPDPLTQSLIHELNSNCHSLLGFYETHQDRRITYQNMANRIVESVRSGLDVCAIFYGHPGVFVDPAAQAIATLRKEGHYARMLPGVSAEDCLFADLAFDPGRTGLQTYEASSFLLYPPTFDPRIPMIIWQIGAIAIFDSDLSVKNAKGGLTVLADVLASHYGEGHEVTIYEASLLGICDPRIDKMPLTQLGESLVVSASTLFVPAKGEVQRSEENAVKLGLPS